MLWVAVKLGEHFAGGGQQRTPMYGCPEESMEKVQVPLVSNLELSRSSVQAIRSDQLAYSLATVRPKRVLRFGPAVQSWVNTTPGCRKLL